ncbi:MAG: MFS transporter [Chloroflexota bacterium]|nr:MFS transporter [Chloroflexota bacterium]
MREGARAAPSRVRTFEALHDGTFRRLWAASWAYYTYRAMEFAVLSWLVLELTDSPAMVALVGVSRAAPMFALGLFAGSVSDRFGRKWVMAVAQALSFAVVAALTWALLAERVAPWHAFAAIALTGTAWALDYTARRAYLASLFEGRSLTNAMALDTGLLISSNLTGPVLGTVLIRWSGFGGAYAGIAVLSALAIALVLTARTDRAPGQRANPLNAIAEAVAVTRRQRPILAAVLVTASFNLFGWPISTQIPVMARDELGASEVLFGLLAGGLGAGALVGAVLLAAFNPTRRGSVYSLGTLVFHAAALGFALSPWYPLSVGLLLIAGVGLVCFGIMQPLLVLEVVPAELRGRAMGALALAIGMGPFGMTMVGFLAEALGPRAGIAALSVVGMGAIVVLRAKFAVLRDARERGVES